VKLARTKKSNLIDRMRTAGIPDETAARSTTRNQVKNAIGEDSHKRKGGSKTLTLKLR